MVNHIRQLETAMGSTRKFVVEEESETVYVQRRGLYAARDIKQGQVLTAEDITALRPALGILPKYKNVLIGKQAKTDIAANEPLFWDNF
jgi:pseudaminic acid synthase